MPNTPELLELLKAGVHFGHKTSRWHPKMAPFIFGERGGVHIVNLEATQAQLRAAGEFVKGLGKEGKILLLVGTKKQAQEIIKKYATEIGMPCVSNRWLGGSITNWGEIYRLIKKYLDLKGKQARGELVKYTKKEQLDFSKDIDRMNRLVGGISTLTKTPDALFIVDIKYEDTTVREANQKNIPIVALCDTNANPDTIQYPIAGNDDAVKSIEFITKFIANAYREGAEERNMNIIGAVKEPVAAAV